MAFWISSFVFSAHFQNIHVILWKNSQVLVLNHEAHVREQCFTITIVSLLYDNDQLSPKIHNASRNQRHITVFLFVRYIYIL